MVSEKWAKINTFVLDVDGVLTDGSVLCLASGEQVRTFLVKDGFAIEKALSAGYHVCVITGGFQEGVRKRLEFLGVKDIFMNVRNKPEVFEKYLIDQNIDPENVLYMGDDLPDYEVMSLCGLAACPSDAVEDIKVICHYISDRAGGKGAVRDVIEKTLKLQRKWPLLGNKANG
ncbi:MAG TPA: HAD family hydrolase [Cytophagales bacterium]|nr:HAD family hydrolase [Cytophagales bacterium]